LLSSGLGLLLALELGVLLTLELDLLLALNLVLLLALELGRLFTLELFCLFTLESLCSFMLELCYPLLSSFCGCLGYPLLCFFVSFSALCSFCGGFGNSSSPTPIPLGLGLGFLLEVLCLRPLQLSKEISRNTGFLCPQLPVSVPILIGLLLGKVLGCQYFEQPEPVDCRLSTLQCCAVYVASPGAIPPLLVLLVFKYCTQPLSRVFRFSFDCRPIHVNVHDWGQDG